MILAWIVLSRITMSQTLPSDNEMEINEAAPTKPRKTYRRSITAVWNIEQPRKPSESRTNESTSETAASNTKQLRKASERRTNEPSSCSSTENADKIRGVYDLTCSLCRKSFPDYFKFKHHRIISHRTEYYCTTCGKFFETRAAKRRHCETVHLQLPTECSTCGRV